MDSQNQHDDDLHRQAMRLYRAQEQAYDGQTQTRLLRARKQAVGASRRSVRSPWVPALAGTLTAAVGALAVLFWQEGGVQPVETPLVGGWSGATSVSITRPVPLFLTAEPEILDVLVSKDEWGLYLELDFYRQLALEALFQ